MSPQLITMTMIVSTTLIFLTLHESAERSHQSSPSTTSLPDQPHILQMQAPNATISNYAKCLALYLDDVEKYETCLQRRADRYCWWNPNVMTSQHDSHNCLSEITAVPTMTVNAQVIKRSHDICYQYLLAFSECFRRAVEMQDLAPCLRQEVLARFGIIVLHCQKRTSFEPPSDGMW